MFQIHGERKVAWGKLVDQIIDDDKIEPGVSPWNSPSFPVPKKKPNDYRLVEDFRKVNDNTEDDAHPLPRIEDILQKQGNCKIWSVLDLKDGYHQMPLKPEHRHITCMSTPKGSYQWKVLVMGLKNGNAMFQRMMEWVLQDLENADPYVDDIIIGSSGVSWEEVITNHERDVRAVLSTLRKNELIVDPRKAHMFMKEVEFCGHILREGRRSPAPGKLLSIQKWELPATITELRGFLGLTNYYSCYVPNYSTFAAPLMSKLQVGRVDGKKGSVKPVEWDDDSRLAFENLKKALANGLEVFRIEPDEPFILRTDASDFALGAVLEQQREGKWVPVAFYSRKLAKGQKNWTPREKETYAIVAALRKWAGWIGFQPVVVKTDHRSLEHWVTENVDTPSGPTGRRARWHETLSQFNLTVEYYPGKENLIADAMSRFAYPASSSREDVCFHGSAASHAEVTKLIQKENEEGRMVGMIRLGSTHTSGSNTSGFKVRFHPGTILISDPSPTTQPLLRTVSVVTRTGAGKTDSISDAPSSSGEEVSVSSPPPASRTRSRSHPIVPSAPMVREMIPPQSSRSTRGRQQQRAQTRDSSTSPPFQKSRVQSPSSDLEASVPVSTRIPDQSPNPLVENSSDPSGQGSSVLPPVIQFGQGSPPVSPVVLPGQGSHPTTPSVFPWQMV